MECDILILSTDHRITIKDWKDENKTQYRIWYLKDGVLVNESISKDDVLFLSSGKGE